MNAIQRILLAVLLAATGCLLLPRDARADATTYSTTKRQFKVGILLIDSTATDGRGPENPDPYVFYVADQRTDVKPQNWEFVNPLAPGVVTPLERDRWLTRDAAHPYDLGQKVTKNMACYWEVYFSKASITDLLKFDLLYIDNHRPTAFTPMDREKLRKLVDAGGVVWIENCGGMHIDGNSPFFLEQLQFRSAGGGGTAYVYKADHPLLNSPYQLTYQEIANLGDKNYAGYVLSTIDPANPNDPNGANQPPNPETLVNIVGNTNAQDANGRYLPYIAAGNYGSGVVIATGGDSGCDINDYCNGVNAGSGGNSGAYGGQNFDAAHTEDLKFLYNMVAWGSQSTTERRNNRRTATSFDTVGAPVVTSFNFDNTFTKNVRPGDIVRSASAPLVVKNAAFVSGVEQGGAMTVRCYDTQPFSDMDGDGNFDDGIPDISLGLPYDEVWRWNGGNGGQPSAPVYGSVLLPNGDHDDRIFVAMPDGTLVIFQAFPRAVTNGPILPQQNPITVAGGGGTYNTGTTAAPAPVFFENRIYQVLPNGLMRCVDAITGAQLFHSFDTAPNYTMQPLGTPTAGFVRQVSQTGVTRGQAPQQTFALASNDSTNDLMLYSPALVTDQNGTPKFRDFAYWLGARNEVTTRVSTDPADQAAGTLMLVTRAAGGGANGPQGGWYYIAVGNGLTRTLTNPTAPFIEPRARVFSAERDPNDLTKILVSAQENYARGNISNRYRVVQGDIFATGKVRVTKVNNGDPDPRPGDILVSVDYDVLYIPDVGPNAGTPPANYAANRTGVGARPFGILDIDFPDLNVPGVLFTTPALSADDSLIFAAEQLWTGQNNAIGKPIASVFAVNEQEGDATLQSSKLRWKYGIFNDATDTQNPFDLFMTRTVDTIPVTDIVPLRNYLKFSNFGSGGSTAAGQFIANPNPPPVQILQAEALRNVRTVGSPITTNDGITYVLARADSSYVGGPVTVIMAFKSNPTITLTLPTPFEETAGVTVLQADLLTDPTQPGVNQAAGSSNPGDRVVMDGATGHITINNSRIQGAKSFNAAQSFVVRYTPKGSRNEQRIVIPPTPLAVDGTLSLPTDNTGQITVNSGGYTPLLWYYVLPGELTPNGAPSNPSPTLIGDYLYYTALVGGDAYLIAVDARPQDNDPNVRIGFGEQILNVSTLDIKAPTQEAKVNHVRMVQRISNSTNALSVLPQGVGGGQGTLLVNSAFGTYAYQQGITLIADSKRLVEAGADGAATWVMDSTKNRTVGGGQEPVFDVNGNITNPPATGVGQITRQTLARPTISRRIGSSDYITADTGNNRVVRTDRAGEVKWSLARFVDPYGILASGEPTTLNGPTDVQYYTTLTLNGGNVDGYEIHYLVADAGNFRIIEVADYFDKQGQLRTNIPGIDPGDHVLVWTTRSQTQGKRYRFQSIQRFSGFGPNGTPYAGFSGYPFLTAIVSNNTVGTGTGESRADFTGGAIVSLSYAPYNTTIALRNGNNSAPAQLWTGNPARDNEPVGNGNVLLSIEKVRVVTNGVATEKRLSTPTYFQQLNIPRLNGGPQRTLFLICDAEGAYVVESTPQGNGTLQNNVLWMFTQSDYDRINGISPGKFYTDQTTGNTVADPPQGTYLPISRLYVPGVAPGNVASPSVTAQLPRFQPTSIQLLPSGNYLISNAWAGRSALFDAGSFTGEVIEVVPSGLSVLIDQAFGDTRRGGTFAGFSVPRLQKGGNLVKNPAAPASNILNKQVMGNPSSNTGLVEQPLSAFRP